MKNTLIILILAISLVLPGTVLAQGGDDFDQGTCIDLQAPSAPGNLQITGNVALSWNEAADEPDCSGIDHYDIYRDDVFIGKTQSTSFNDGPLADGTYTYKVIAFDKAWPNGNEGPPAIGQIVIGGVPPETPPGGGDGGGAGGGGGSGGGGNGATDNGNGETNGDQTGDSGSTACLEDWVCTTWSECIENSQTRECADLNACGTTDDKPVEQQSCSIETIETDNGQTIIPPEGLPITALLVGSLGNPAVTGLLVLIILAILYIGYRIATKKEFRYAYGGKKRK